MYKKYGKDAVIADVTSKAKDGLVKLSPFYPHGGVPVPNSEGYTATCVEAVWQGLKVFEMADVDVEMFKNGTKRNIKRTVRKFGRPLGHRYGVKGTELLTYVEARKRIYIPTFRWVLENRVADIIARLREAFILKVKLMSEFNEKTQTKIVFGETLGETELTERQLRIYNEIKNNVSHTAKSLARQLELSQRTVEREISFLRSNGFIDKSTKENKSKWVVLK